MAKFDDKLRLHFITECFFDTVLLKKLLQTDKRLMHRRGCNNVVNDLNSERLINDFAVALIDKDKSELDYLRDCDIIYNAHKLILLKHKSRSQFLIQLNPPLEKWIIEILDENGLAIESFNYVRNYKKLKQQIKDDINNETDEKLNKLVYAIINTNCTSILKIKFFLEHLTLNKSNADINKLKNG